MNEFRQHIPGYFDVEQPDFAEFKDTKELLNLDIVKKYIGENFSHFAMSGNYLMVVSDGGSHWWVVGSIKNPEEIDLPQWKPIAEEEID